MQEMEEKDKRILLNGLLNVRALESCDDYFLLLQDKLLSFENGLEIIDVEHLKFNKRVARISGDILNMNSDILLTFG